MKKFMPISKEQLEQLPDEVIEIVKSTLKAFNECPVIYENGRYHYVSGIKSHYASDHKFIGIAYADDIYTKEERKDHAIEMSKYCQDYN